MDGKFRFNYSYKDFLTDCEYLSKRTSGISNFNWNLCEVNVNSCFPTIDMVNFLYINF